MTVGVVREVVESPGPRRRLPPWASWPVLFATPPVAFLVALCALYNPFAVLLTLVPGALVVAAFAWLDRVEPEPWAERLHAFLWGATISVLVAASVNEVVASSFGIAWSAVVSAPIVEEVMKAFGVLVAARRRRLRSWFDGAVYAGLVAAGFALVENVVYFLEASDSGMLIEVFALRGLATPFAHPLFTISTGMLLGRFASARRSVAFLGLPVAIVLHAGWNAASLLEPVYAGVLLGVAFVLFWTAFVVLLTIRLRATRSYRALLPVLAFRFGFDPFEIALLADWAAVLRARRTLPPLRRHAFEELHRAVRGLSPYVTRRVEPPAEVLARVSRARAEFASRRLPPPRPGSTL